MVTVLPRKQCKKGALAQSSGCGGIEASEHQYDVCACALSVMWHTTLLLRYLSKRVQCQGFTASRRALMRVERFHFPHNLNKENTVHTSDASNVSVVLRQSAMHGTTTVLHCHTLLHTRQPLPPQNRSFAYPVMTMLRQSFWIQENQNSSLLKRLFLFFSSTGCAIQKDFFQCQQTQCSPNLF